MNKDAREALSALDNVPIESMLESLRYSMAKAQAALDRTAIDTFKEMVNPDNRIRMEGGESYSLLEIGFSPSFYPRPPSRCGWRSRR